MRLSEDRVAVIARDVANTLLDEELVDLEIEEDRFIFLLESLIIKDLVVFSPGDQACICD